MKELIRNLYKISGSYADRITKMLIFDVVKGVFEGMMASSIVFCFMKVCEKIFYNREIFMSDVYVLIAIAGVSLAGKILFGYLADRNKYEAAYSLGEENRILIGDRLKNVGMGYFNKSAMEKTAGGLSAVVGELETVGIVIVEQMLVGAIQTFIVMIFVLPYDFVTAVIMFVTLVLGMAVNVVAQKKTDEATEKILQLKLSLWGRILEYVNGIGVAKVFGEDRKVVDAVKRSVEENKKGFLAVEKILVPTQFLFMATFKIGTIAIVMAAIMRGLAGDIDLVKTVVLIMISFVVFSGFELAGSMFSIKGVAVQNLKSLMALRNLEMIKEGTVKEIKKADIEIKNISFGYDDRVIFDNFSLNIPEKKMTALVGLSGSGKTTLCNLVSRFWDVDAGEILVGGVNVKDYKYDSLLANFSFVFQDVYLFDDTVSNNIKFGNPDATEEEVIAAAKKAQCHEFIMKMPNGYETLVSEGGKRLSGGERQRISIARAMLKPSKIVILDEATSSIDPENERELLMALKNLLKDKTVIVIAHKISTIEGADNIVVLKEGKIMQEGKHEDLIKQDGIYKNFLEDRKKSEKWVV